MGFMTSRRHRRLRTRRTPDGTVFSRMLCPVVPQPGVMIMQSYKFAVVLIASITGTSLPAIAQGAGGGAAGGAGTGSASTGTAGTAGASTTSSSPHSSESQTATQNDPNNPSPQSKTANTVAGEQKAAVSGANTVAQPGGVSAPGVGVGHAANGLPIGSPGSGLGSPEHPVDGKVK
jgi:hypothetical protein